ncbi:unnamed protein product [Rotaria sordida]|uniref:Uncharacterized protein n=2 Tax=Rotaria sordida TaxID=392033 RepID=A0A819UFK1_9BILA|nr:unnamed protein product [Rotaria sordida]CAF4130630.1 unnamed protein product [Rotaria sordida]
MATPYNVQNKTLKRHGSVCKTQYGNFDAIDTITSDRFSNNDNSTGKRQKHGSANDDDNVLVPEHVKQSQPTHILRKPINEQVLSQKMSQLSTHTVNETSAMMKSI